MGVNALPNTLSSLASFLRQGEGANSLICVLYLLSSLVLLDDPAGLRNQLGDLLQVGIDHD